MAELTKDKKKVERQETLKLCYAIDIISWNREDITAKQSFSGCFDSPIFVTGVIDLENWVTNNSHEKYDYAIEIRPDACIKVWINGMRVAKLYYSLDYCTLSMANLVDMIKTCLGDVLGHHQYWINDRITFRELYLPETVDNVLSTAFNRLVTLRCSWEVGDFKDQGPYSLF